MKKTIRIAVISIVLIFAVFVGMAPISLAYFSAFLDKVGVNSVMIELIFDRLDFKNQAVIDAGYADHDENGNEIPWGSSKNPYVISQKYHVQNLSVLQNLGFFAEKKDENGKPVQPHFLVCTPEGKPVVVDCEGMSIAPIGTHEYPFVGEISGAPFATDESDDIKYGEYGVSVSTIANLKVTANEKDSPDIGFFGFAGYYGTYNDEDKTVTGGYAAKIDDLLFADVTVSSSSGIANLLSEWWNNLFGGHENYQDTHGETHHVGIVAGHAEFATITDVSVFYSEGVYAFDLVSDNVDGGESNTNYYSSTGLIGLLKYVNPIDESGTLDGTGGVSDSDIVGDNGDGGGGDESGTMTGYMLAESLFAQHEDYLKYEKLGTSDVYDVREMKKMNGDTVESLFSSVSMRERNGILDFSVETHTYYYFQDSVFTFAMSASSKDNTRTDYVQKIWRLEEETPYIYGAEDGKLHFSDDLGSSKRIAYKLVAADSVTAGGYYVLAHYDASSNTLRIFNLTKATAADNMIVIDSEEIFLGDETHGAVETEFYDSENTFLKSIYLIGTQTDFYEYAFQYQSSSASIVNPQDSNKLGVTSSYSSIASPYPQATIYYGDAAEKTNSSWLDSGATAYYYSWNFSSVGNGRFTVHSSYSFYRGSWLARTYTNGWAKLKLANNSIAYDYGVSNNEDSAQTVTPSFSEENYFTLFKVNTNTYDSSGNITNSASTGNIELTPKNIVPILKTNDEGDSVPDTLYSFDPSKYVLEYKKDTDTYKLAPIRSYRLNNGKGELLTQLNHIVKLSKATGDNYQLNLFDEGSFLDFVNTNSGGVVGASIGTNGQYATIPAGMIAFEINEASVAKPSQINIIVAVNPEQIANGRVGIWKYSTSYKNDFSLDEPLDSFMLPTSKTATAWSTDSGRILNVSEHIEERNIAGKKEYYTVLDKNGTPEQSKIYLGGKVALIYYSFNIEETGVYFIGAKDGPLSVSYFSVTGAAGAGNDGRSGSPLGRLDFVYDYNNEIVTVDRLFDESEQLEENYNKYYPSYLFVAMLPEKSGGGVVKIQNERIQIRRFIYTIDGNSQRRCFSISGQNLAELRVISEFMEDLADDIETS